MISSMQNRGPTTMREDFSLVLPLILPLYLRYKPQASTLGVVLLDSFLIPDNLSLYTIHDTSSSIADPAGSHHHTPNLPYLFFSRTSRSFSTL